MAQSKRDSVSTRFLRSEIKRRWQQLTASDIEECCSQQSKLAELLETRYGYAQSRAEKEVDLFFGEFHNRLRMAA